MAAGEFYNMMRRAQDRCLDTARGEDILGAPGSAQAYREIASEMWDVLWWIATQTADPRWQDGPGKY